MFHLGFTLVKSFIRLTSYVSAVAVRGATWIELDARIAQNAELGRCWLGVCRAERVLNGSGSTVRNATTNCCARSNTRTQRVRLSGELDGSLRHVVRPCTDCPTSTRASRQRWSASLGSLVQMKQRHL